MRILPNRTLHARDTLRGVTQARAAGRRNVVCRCRQCGFVAFHPLQRCPACGRQSWPFEPLHARAGANAYQAVDAAPSCRIERWAARIAAALRAAAFRRPRASTAPLLSILTLVLLVGGYVLSDRMCKADPACRAPDARDTGARAAHLLAQASDDTAAAAEPALPVLPVPVYPFHTGDATQLASDPRRAARSVDAGVQSSPPAAAQVAQSVAPNRASADMRGCASRSASGCARTAPPSVRTAVWHGGRDSAHRARAVRRVGTHVRHVRRAAATEEQMALLYRGH
ncbi:hypothetical protein QZM96_03970 [Burkholderia multivorans]|uniref:hypothetical protein n=1 Tax=Burkholderia multivorans TaxID=87883 RepID=UPI000CFF2D6D|nr:hypothetical protein [Burkholderia multivorans]MDN8002236.1 hypothetical protein [Burkholderia multivorans]PRG97704.1 hypothetical protein C6T60_28115 [Burkholderia multivorans]